MSTETPENQEEIKFDRRKHVIYEFKGELNKGLPVVEATIDPKFAKAEELKQAARNSTLTEEEKIAEAAAIAKEMLVLRQASEAIKNAILSSPRTYHWSHKIGVPVDPETGQPSGTVACWRGTELDWLQTLDSVLLMAKAAEWKPNTQLYLVTSPEIAALLSDLNGYQSVKTARSLPLYEVGNYRKMRIMVDPYFPTNRIMVATGDLTIPGAVNIISSTGVTIVNLDTRN